MVNLKALKGSSVKHWTKCLTMKLILHEMKMPIIEIYQSNHNGFTQQKDNCKKGGFLSTPKSSQ